MHKTPPENTHAEFADNGFFPTCVLNTVKTCDDPPANGSGTGESA